MKIIIVGGSLGGLFAGVLLQQAGHDITIYERSRRGLDGRGAGLVGQTDLFAILRAAGCEHIAQFGVVARARVTLGREGDVIDHVPTPQSQLSWDRIYRAFYDKVAHDAYMLDRMVTDVEVGSDVAVVHFADGSSEAADLVLGADGVGSVVRRAVDEGKPHYAGYVAWRGLYPESRLSEKAATTLADQFAFYSYPGSHILGYLVPGADGATEPGLRRYNWVWYRGASELSAVLMDRDGISHKYSLSPGAMHPTGVDALRDMARTALPPQFVDAVMAADEPFIQAIFDYQSPKMVHGRIALLGDAACLVRPHTAMGVAKAAGDVLALRKHLDASSDVGAALSAYEAERLPEAKAIAAYGLRLGGSLGKADHDR